MQDRPDSHNFAEANDFYICIYKLPVVGYMEGVVTTSMIKLVVYDSRTSKSINISKESVFQRTEARDADFTLSDFSKLEYYSNNKAEIFPSIL